MNAKREEPETRAIQRYRRADLPVKWVEQAENAVIRLSELAKVLAVDLKYVKPRLTQALIDEIKARLVDLESGWPK